MAVMSALQAGWNIGVLNLPENYVKCFIESVQFNQSIFDQCEDAAELDLSEATNFWSLCVSIFAIGAMFGSFIGGTLADKIGRKRAMMVNAVYGIIAVALCASCRLVDSAYVLMVGRILVGVNAGINCTIAPVYNVEIAPLNKRGRFGTFFQLGVTGGSVLSNIIGLPWLLGTNDFWPYLVLLGCFPSILQLIMSCFVPESPLWLENNGKFGEADLARLGLYGSDYKEDENIVIYNQDEDHDDTTPKKLGVFTAVKRIFTEAALRNAIIVSSMLMVIQQFCGINAIVFYSTSIFEEAGIPSEWSGLTSVGLGIFKWSFLWVALWLVEKLGRRPLMLVGCIGMFLMCIVTTILLSFLDTEDAAEDENTDSDAVLAYISVVPVILYVMAFELGPGPIPWMITNEFVPSEFKAGGQAICSFVNWTGVFIIGLIFEPLENVIGQYVFLIFGVVCLLGFVYIYFRMPETKNRPIEELQEEFASRKACC